MTAAPGVPARAPAGVEVHQMQTVLRLLPGSPLYCRVDGVVQGREFVLMEVEVNEPGLGLDLAQGSAERFADALLRRL